jgi:hypothetical protein
MTDIVLEEGYEYVYNSKGEIVGYQAVYVPPAPQPRTRLTRLEFRNKFTPTEKVALYTAAETDINVKILLDDVAAAEYIELTDQEVSDAINYLAGSGVIDAARVPEILAGIPQQ